MLKNMKLFMIFILVLTMECFLVACGDDSIDDNQNNNPNQPHVHEYVEGKCGCGKKDPEYDFTPKTYLRDLTQGMSDKRFYYIFKLNDQDLMYRLSDERIKLFEEQFSEMLSCEVEEMVEEYDTKLLVSFNYELNNYLWRYNVIYSEQGLIVKIQDKSYQVKNPDDEILLFFEEMYSWFGVPDEEVVYEEFDYMSDGRLEYLQKNYKGYPQGFGFEEHMEQNGYIMESTSSVENAITILRNQYNKKEQKAYSIELVDESEYYYILKVIWGPENIDITYENIYFSFKKEVYDHKTNTILIKDKEVIKKILDLKVHANTWNMYGRYVLFSNLEEYDDYYRYIWYQISTSVGDFDVPDQIVYYLGATIVDKNNGIIKSSYQLPLKEIYIAGQRNGGGYSNGEGFIPDPIVFDVTEYINKTTPNIDLTKPIKVDLKTFMEEYNYPYIDILWEEYFTGILVMYQETVNDEYEYQYSTYRNLSVVDNVLNIERILYPNNSKNNVEKTITHIELLVVPNDWKKVDIEFEGINVQNKYMTE